MNETSKANIGMVMFPLNEQAETTIATETGLAINDNEEQLVTAASLGLTYTYKSNLNHFAVSKILHFFVQLYSCHVVGTRLIINSMKRLSLLDGVMEISIFNSSSNERCNSDSIRLS